MKKKIVIMVAMVLLIACIAVTLASCSRDKNNENQVNVSVGASVKKILEADFAGYEAQTKPYQSSDSTREENIRANYATKAYDYVKTETGFSEYSQCYYQDVDAYYCRNGKLFYSSYRCFQEGDSERISYLNSIKFSFEGLAPHMDIEAAKIGLAMMLSVHENSKRWEVPENGIWTGDVVWNPSSDVDFDSYELIDMGFLEALHNISWFKYATAPITQEQLIRLLTALAITDGPYEPILMDEFYWNYGRMSAIAHYADLILKNGELKEGQSAYDYLMGAFDVMFADVEKTYGQYVKEDLFPSLSEWTDSYNFSNLDNEESFYCNMYFDDIVDWFCEDVFKLTTGNPRGFSTPVFSFSDTGELVGIKDVDGYSGADILFELTFTDTPSTLEDIDGERAIYLDGDSSGDLEDTLTAYADTVANFATKSLEDVRHFETKSFNAFRLYFSELKGNANFYATHYCYVIEYKIDNKVVASTFVPKYDDESDINVYYVAGEDGYFGYVDGEWWRFNRAKDNSWKKVKADTVPNVYSSDPYSVLKDLLEAQDYEEYYSLVEWEDGAFEFEVDGRRYRLADDDTIRFTYTDGQTIDISYEESSYLNNNYVGGIGSDAEEAAPKPDKQTFDAALKASIEAKSVTYRTVDTWGYESNPYCIDFENNKAHDEYYDNYYAFENDKFYEYRYGYQKQISSKTYDEVFAYPVKALEGCAYEDTEYDRFNEEFVITIANVKYAFKIANGYIEQMTVTKGGYDTIYKFSDFGTTTITLPTKYKMPVEEFSAALKKTFEASSYTATRRFESGLTVVEQFDHKNQLASAKWTNKNDEEMLNILRAVAEDKVWMYSNASGQWIRAELDFEPDSYIDSVSELMSFKRDVESRYPSGEYTFDWDSEKDEYTFKNANFDCVITFKDGYLATLGVKSGADTVLEFSNYNEVSLALPTLGQVDEDARTAFKQAVENSSKANSFRMEFEAIVEDMPLTFETDVVKGVKSLTTEYVMTATTPEEYQSGNFKRVDMAQIYREWSNNYTTAWSRTVTTTSTGQMTLGNWSSGARTSAPEETHKADMWFYNFADSMTAGGLPIDALFALSKYDKATGEYIVYGYDLADMHIVEYRFKVQGGYISEVTISDKALLESMGVQSDSLKIRYSKYDEITLGRPQGVN